MEFEHLLLEANILKKEEGKIILLPNRVFIWNEIVNYLKNKFNKLNYLEVYTTDLVKLVDDSKILPSKYLSLKYSDSNIELNTFAKFEKEIEEARNDSIDVLEVYNLLGKELLGIPFICGKDYLDEGKNIITTLVSEENIESNYLGKKGNLYFTKSKIDISILSSLLLTHLDENGLVFPPKIAPKQIVIIPIKVNEKGVLKGCKNLLDELNENGYRVILDQSLDTNKKEKWIKLGIPLIIEIGPRDSSRRS